MSGRRRGRICNSPAKFAALCLIIVVIFINDSLQQRRYANEIINVSSAIHHHSTASGGGGGDCGKTSGGRMCAHFAGKERDNHYGQQAIYFYAPWPKYYSGEWRRRCVSIWQKALFPSLFGFQQTKVPASQSLFLSPKPFFPSFFTL